jgi:Leucine-rich repeat (LRR) protein
VWKMQHARAVASPILSAVVPGQEAEESVLEWTLGRISLPPSSPQTSPIADTGEEMRLEDLHNSSRRSSISLLDAVSTASKKKQDDEAERERIEALKAHIPACLSNVLSLAPAAVTGEHYSLRFFALLFALCVLRFHLTMRPARMSSLSLQNSNLVVIPHCLSKFPALSKLDLSFNRLESVDSAFVLNHLPRLLNLNLSNNRIQDIAQIQVREKCIVNCSCPEPKPPAYVPSFFSFVNIRSSASTLASRRWT